jgi:hypothetical protein
MLAYGPDRGSQSWTYSTGQRRKEQGVLIDPSTGPYIFFPIPDQRNISPMDSTQSAFSLTLNGARPGVSW